MPDENALACPTGDPDDDGVPNGQDPAPLDPCIPDENALACPTVDADGDGVPNGQDPDPLDPCIPNACEVPDVTEGFSVSGGGLTSCASVGQTGWLPLLGVGVLGLRRRRRR